MLQYILECIAFQLVFLIIYDLFLKRETFFQWNRLYLIGTYIISMALPWIKIEAMKTNVPATFQAYPEFLWNGNDAVMSLSAAKETAFNISWEYVVLFGGMFLATLFFGYKLYQIYSLKRKGEVHFYKDFTQIIISNSSIAFSFFKSIFLGDKVVAKEHKNIVQHELVHIRQRHSYDLIFFELMRIVGWFNPLVYVYQNRISELHEFIADAQVAKTDKTAQYEFLLSQVFQTQHISFINQFFKTSLIKKRIVMLTKQKSKQIFKLKYILLVPIILGMLLYTSCDLEESNRDADEIETVMVVTDIDKMSTEEDEKLFLTLKSFSDKGGDWQYLLKDDSSSILYESSINDSYIKFDDHDEKIYATMLIQGSSMGKGTVMGVDANGIMVPFSQIDEVPVFPGCEGETDKRACFRKMIQKHISKNFRYPQKAQELGIQGRVSILFTISEDGSIQKIRKRGPDKLLENEAVRIISLLPKMTPGKQDGKVVGVPFSIPITFRLEQTNFNMNATSSIAGKQYEMLLKERARLLETSNENNPVIKNLDEQIASLKKAMDENGLKESESLMQKLFDGVYDDVIPFSKVDTAPTFPGCENELDKRACFQKSIQRHISKNFDYPEEAQQNGIQGRVAVLFIITSDGSIKGLKTRGPDSLLEEEAKRIISRLPKMIPGSHEGKLADVTFSIPITFKLQ